MGLRDLIESVRELASAHRVAIIASFLIALVALYVLAPIEWQVFFNDKTPSFFPFGVTLFDVLAIATSLVIGLVCHGLIQLYYFLKKKRSKPSLKKIAKIWERDLRPLDHGILVCIVYNHSINEERPDVMASMHKLKEMGLIVLSWPGVAVAAPQVQSFIYEQTRLGNIDVEKLFPDRYRSRY